MNIAGTRRRVLIERLTKPCRSFSSLSDDSINNSNSNSIDNSRNNSINDSKENEKEEHGFILTPRQRKALNKLIHKTTNDSDDMMLTNTINNNADITSSSSSSSSLTQTLLHMKEQSILQDMLHDARNPKPWFQLLVHPAKALWRSNSQKMPAHLSDTFSNILTKSKRTSKQLKRTYDRIILNQKALAQLREYERRLLLNHHTRTTTTTDTTNTTNTTGMKHTYANAKAHTTSIQHKKLQFDNKHSVDPTFYKPEQSLSYLKYRLVPNYYITQRVIKEVFSLLGTKHFPKPNKVLDVGVGVGSSSAALLDFFHSPSNNTFHAHDDHNYLHHIDWIHAIDPSQSMRDASNYLLSNIIDHHHNTNQYNKNLPKTRLTFGSTLSSSSTTSSNTSTSPNTGSFDLILCTYTLSELPSVASSLSLSAMIWEKLNPNGIVIFIEPGNPDGFNMLRSVRSMLLDCCPPTTTSTNTNNNSDDINVNNNNNNDDDDGGKMIGDEECHVIAPCTHNGKCPMQRHKPFFRNKENSNNNYQDDTDSDFQQPLQQLDGDSEFDMETEENDKDFYDYEDNMEDESDDDDDDDDDVRDEGDEDTVHDIQTMSSKISTSTTIDMPSSSLPFNQTNVFHSSFCSFVHSIPAIGNHAGEQGKSGEKFSYLVLQKRIYGLDSEQHTPPDNKLQQLNKEDDTNVEQNTPFHDINIAELLSQALEANSKVKNHDVTQQPTPPQEYSNFSNTNKEYFLSQASEIEEQYLDSKGNPLNLELLQGDTNRKSWGRIIRAPIKKRGHIIIDYCTSSPSSSMQNNDYDDDENNTSNETTNDDQGWEDWYDERGMIIRHKVTKSASIRAAPGMYGAARKARWGGFWPDVRSKDQK